MCVPPHFLIPTFWSPSLSNSWPPGGITVSSASGCGVRRSKLNTWLCALSKWQAWARHSHLRAQSPPLQNGCSNPAPFLRLLGGSKVNIEENANVVNLRITCHQNVPLSRDMAKGPCDPSWGASLLLLGLSLSSSLLSLMGRVLLLCVVCGLDCLLPIIFPGV